MMTSSAERDNLWAHYCVNYGSSLTLSPLILRCVMRLLGIFHDIHCIALGWLVEEGRGWTQSSTVLVKNIDGLGWESPFEVGLSPSLKSAWVIRPSWVLMAHGCNCPNPSIVTTWPARHTTCKISYLHTLTYYNVLPSYYPTYYIVLHGYYL